MENNEMHDPWVDRRIAALDPPDTWQPDSVRGWRAFDNVKRPIEPTAHSWTWAAAAASLTGIGPAAADTRTLLRRGRHQDWQCRTAAPGGAGGGRFSRRAGDDRAGGQTGAQGKQGRGAAGEGAAGSKFQRIRQRAGAGDSATLHRLPVSALRHGLPADPAGFYGPVREARGK